ncbi:MAG: hypothetical protein EHM35_01190 [Planctomycetaceae bacterium]|nr:MAG: hypothetical protein EHM35_01190 [Planctomycetaceae bacterium]
MLISRRGLLTGLVSLLAAPAIVRATSIMPVKALPVVVPNSPLPVGIVDGFWFRPQGTSEWKLVEFGLRGAAFIDGEIVTGGLIGDVMLYDKNELPAQVSSSWGPMADQELKYGLP